MSYVNLVILSLSFTKNPLIIHNLKPRLLSTNNIYNLKSSTNYLDYDDNNNKNNNNNNNNNLIIIKKKIIIIIIILIIIIII